MTQQEFDAKVPLILTWIQKTLADHAASVRPIASLKFKRLPLYFPADFLEKAKVVYVHRVPTPPLSAIGLPQFSDFENMTAAGMTYLDTFFAHDVTRDHEALHFHELVHVVQWQTLGPKKFIAAYADGLERSGYRASPLEMMAYTLESVFQKSQSPFDVVAIVQEQLKALYA
jgi:hypothetical protein